MDLLVVGAGEMGRWFARALQANAPDDVHVSVADADRATAEDAAAELDAAVVDADPVATTGHEVVCIAVPIPVAVDAIEAWAPVAERALFDVTGTMRGPVRAMEEAATDLEWASLHPMFSPETEPGTVPEVIGERGSILGTVESALRDRDNEVFETTAAEHDEAMETVQAKAHAAVLAYALATEPVDERFHTSISGPLDELATAIVEDNSRVYADIQAAFEGADDVAAAAERIADADGDAERFRTLFRDAGGE